MFLEVVEVVEPTVDLVMEPVAVEALAEVEVMVEEVGEAAIVTEEAVTQVLGQEVVVVDTVVVVAVMVDREVMEVVKWVAMEGKVMETVGQEKLYENLAGIWNDYSHSRRTFTGLLPRCATDLNQKSMLI